MLARTALHILSVGLFLALALPAARSSEPAPVTSPSAEIDPGFLLLPAYDVQWVNPPKSARVGDTLSVRITPDAGNGVGKSAGAGKTSSPVLPKEIQIKVPPGTENADDLPFSWGDPVNNATDGSLTLSVTPLKPGELTLPSLGLADSAGKVLARTIPLSLSVVSSIAGNDPKPKQPDPPRPPVSLGIPVMTLIVLAVLALFLLAGVVFLLVRWSRANRKKPLAKPAEPPKPEDERALLQLVQLEKKGLIKAGQFKAHYFALSEIIKHYVGSRYEFDAAESTTFEMLTRLQDKGGAGVDSLREIFDRLDRVKFTDHIPGSAEGAELLEQARQLVISTRRPPPVVLNTEKASTHASR